ncbi:tripartite tricarboxylate transporter permease [Alkalihalophilus marmarensis]|uniref:tripartite tricarboxylate transporter permease n=1 Tax=Alkalihalophilus marmarensis TaxID=521377 RepID=UPI002DC00874|nr:tripartite tricarboxylate transporter permease [Alkalihalophilus marmarensis]MEC2071339.1 tripartite tricarboxylate transporter permease [Alkalihalophilus marmarensis]
MENLLLSLQAILQWDTLLLMFIGVLAGIIFGSIPGFTITMAVALTLPFSFGLEPLQGIALMMGVWIGGASGGLISACLLGIPGTPSAVATTFDGYPMTRKGEPGRALAIGLWSSFFGAIIGGLILVLAAPMLAGWALRFGPWEFFALMVFGLSAIASLGQGNLLKGIAAGLIGMFVGTIGLDPVLGTERFTFGTVEMLGGFDFLPILIGIFAFSQLLSEVQNKNRQTFDFDKKVSLSYPIGKTIKDMFSSIVNVIRSSVIGTIVGALPGAGSSIANLLSYDIAKKSSKHPEKFGKGTKDGVIAAETANNSSEGGALIPTLALGIPGSAVTAMMMGALLIHGIQPGPFFLTTQPVLANGIFLSFFISAFFMLLIQTFGIRAFLRINDVPLHYLLPIVITLCALGSFAINNRVFDIWVLLLFGVIGYLLKKTDFSLAAFVLGVILGPMTEENLRRALETNPDPMLFITRPISGTLLFLTVASIGYALYSNHRYNKKVKAEQLPEDPSLKV